MFKPFIMGESTDLTSESKFKYYFTQHSKELYYLACVYVKDTCIIEDIISDSFVKLWINMPNIKEYAIRKYLQQTVKNACIDYLRARRDIFTIEECPTLVDLDNNPLDHLISQEDEVRIVVAINELPQKYQKMLRLRVLGKLKYDEIAQEMNMPIHAVKLNLREAISILRKRLGILLVIAFFHM